MSDETAGRVSWDRHDLLVLGGLVLLGFVVRLLFVVLTELPPFDPWRHLQLVRNLREGAGFTLFDGQPYLWYGPIWYRLCSLLPVRVGPEWVAALFSLLSVPALYLILRTSDASRGCTRQAAAAAGALAALSGPLVAYTCHFGPEAFALFLFSAGLLAAVRGGRALSALGAGLAFGLAIVLRANFAFVAPLFIPIVRSRTRALAFLSGGALPLAFQWWRNRGIIAAHDYVFTWDGLATPSSGFNPLSTLFVQLHPDVQQGLRRLHELIIPVPEWIRRPDGISWDLLLFVLCGVGAVIVCRRAALIVAAALALGYFLLLDRSLSSNFFRIYLPLFPVFFLAAGRVAGGGPRLRRLGWGLVVLALLAGAPALRPPKMFPLEAVTPPAELLQEEAYMVNSARYHPESLIYRFPDKRFIGMPLDADDFEQFRALYPRYEAILWHDFSVQDGLGQYLKSSGRYRVVRSAVNAHGHRYTVLRARGDGSVL